MLNNTSEKEITTVLGSLVMGAAAIPFSPVLGYSLLAAGAGVLAVDLIDPLVGLFCKGNEYDKEIEIINNILTINSVRNSIGMEAQISRVKTTSNGFSLELEIPLGLSYKDIEKNIPAISCALGGKEVIQEGNILHIKFTELLNDYELKFPPILRKERNKLITYVGENLEGPVKIDLSQAGGILLAGQTGSGKSTLLRYMLTHIATNYNENEINLYLNDMKFTELALFKDLKITKWHNTDPDLVKDSLDDFWKEVQDRYKLFQKYDCVDAYEYEALTGKKIPINLMVIEEFTILSGRKYKDNIELLNNILSQCRASKSHVIITTQRPDAKTLDPRLKANVTHTIGLKTKTAINSQIVCDEDCLKDLRGDGHGYIFDKKKREFQSYFLESQVAKEILQKYKKPIGNNNVIESKKIKVVEEPTFFEKVKNIIMDNGDEF